MIVPRRVVELEHSPQVGGLEETYLKPPTAYAGLNQPWQIKEYVSVSVFLLGPNGGAFLFFKAGFEVQALLQKRRNLELPLGLASKTWPSKLTWLAGKSPDFDRSFLCHVLFSGA